MNTIIVLATVLAVVLALPTDTYDEKYDNFDGKALVENDRLLLSYLKCFLGESHCSPEGNEFKTMLPEALHTKCAKCTPKQKEIVRLVCRAVIAKFPEQWEQLNKKQDPKGEFADFIEEFLKTDD